jgi:hypothetical protein
VPVKVLSSPTAGALGVFGAVVLDEAHLAAALRYVALNPVRARRAAVRKGTPPQRREAGP